MPVKKGQTTKAKNTKNVSSKKNKNSIKPANQYDKPLNLVVAGFIGLILSYTLLSRALNTGSYWEYFIGLAFLFMAIRLFIRSIRLK